METENRRALLKAPERWRSTPLGWFLFNERELRAGWRLTIYFVLALVAMAILFRLAQPLMGSVQNMDARSMLLAEFMQAAAAFGIALLMGKLEGRTIGIYGLPARSRFRRHFWQGAAWGFVMITAVVLLIDAFGGFRFGARALGTAGIAKYAAVWGLVFLLTGFFEEFFFRGYAQFTLTTGMGFWPSALLLSALFGSVHLLNPGEGPVGALSVFVIGMFFCLTLRLTGNLWFAVGMHAAWDWGETFFYSVPNSGIVAPGHLFNSTLSGPKWLSGGTIGPEGSVMAFAVMAAAFVVFAIAYRRPAAGTNPAEMRNEPPIAQG